MVYQSHDKLKFLLLLNEMDVTMLLNNTAHTLMTIHRQEMSTFDFVSFQVQSKWVFQHVSILINQALTLFLTFQDRQLLLFIKKS